MKITALKQDTKNANKGTRRGRKVVENSLLAYGAGRSILIDKSGNIIAGNKTAEGAIAMGLEDVQIVKSDGTKLIAVQRTDLDINDPKARALAIADNRASELSLDWDLAVLAEFDDQHIDLSGMWSPSELESLLAPIRGEDRAPEAKPDQAAELQRKWGTKLGQLWLIGAHWLFCGDSTDPASVARLLAGKPQQPALMITDPPYGVDYDPDWRDGRVGTFGAHATQTKNVANDHLANWEKAWELFPGDVCYVWCASLHLHEVASSLIDSGFDLRSSIIWVKQHFAISQGHYHWMHEPCWYAVRKGKTANWIGDRAQTTVWDIASLNPAGRKEERFAHSTQKPIECMARPMRNHEGAVYDPFLGSGTTMVAAEQLNRICFAIELDPGYVAVALERMSEMGLKPTLSNG